MGSLATALAYNGQKVDPIWLMGTSGWAFRIIVNEIQCPSAMSVFDWSLLPEAVEQAGHRCTYISRLWWEGELEQERREQAHAEIVKAVERGIPAIAWDIEIPEWGLIVGYNEDHRSYDTLSRSGRTGSMAFAELGNREVKILSVAIPGEPNGRSRQEIVLNSLQAAVRHAEQGEWMNRPQYMDGLAAYELWARTIEPEHNEKAMFDFAGYYAGHYYGARCYARDYLARIADGDTTLGAASAAYGRVAECLRPVWERFSQVKRPDDATLSALAQSIRQAGDAEKEGINLLKSYLVRA